MQTPDAPRAAASLIQKIAQAFTRADFTVDAVAQLLGPGAYAALDREQVVPAVLATGGWGIAADQPALPSLVRFFLLGQPLTAAQLREAMAGVVPGEMVEAGLALEASGGFTAAVDLRPYAFEDALGAANLWVASDLSAHQTTAELRRDHVLGIGRASLTLAQTVVRAPVASALDLGCGCGIQTFHLLRHAEHVTATDISQRALEFTEFNLLLNAEALRLDPKNLAERVSLRLGSKLEPVAGERFELVVSNPPFVITPRASGTQAYTYRDGGMEGDSFLSELVAGLPAVLASGGTAQMLGNWEVHEEPWRERVASWFAPELDVWVLQRDVSGPDQYAETWLQDASQNRDRAAYREAYADYLSDFQARGVNEVGFGMIWLRAPGASKQEDAAGVSAVSVSEVGEGAAGEDPAQPLRRFEEVEHQLAQPIGAAVSAAVERWDWLQRADLAAAHLEVAEDVTEERHQFPGAEHPSVILLRQGAGFRRSTILTTELAGFVSACDGELAVGKITGALTALLGYEVKIDAAVSALVAEGFLVPATAR